MRTDESLDLEITQADLPATPSDLPAEFEWNSGWSIKRRLASFVVGVAFAVIGVSGLIPMDQADVSSWVLVMTTGFLGFHWFRRALDPRPRFEVNSDGITDRNGAGGGDLFIGWEEIREIRGKSFGMAMEVLVRDPAEVRKKAGWPRRLWMMLGAAMGKRAVTIASDGLGPNMRRFREHVEAGLLAYERVELGLPPSSDTEAERIEGG